MVDTRECLERYERERALRFLRNSLKVARSRLKATLIRRARAAYADLGGTDWERVEKLLSVVL